MCRFECRPRLTNCRLSVRTPKRHQTALRVWPLPVPRQRRHRLFFLSFEGKVKRCAPETSLPKLALPAGASTGVATASLTLRVSMAIEARSVSEGSSCHAWRRPLSSARRRGIRSVRLPAARRRRSPGCVVFPDASCRPASGVRAWLDSGLAEPLAHGSSPGSKRHRHPENH